MATQGRSFKPTRLMIDGTEVHAIRRYDIGVSTTERIVSIELLADSIEIDADGNVTLKTYHSS